MKKTVLIVEDNELNMKLFNDLLEGHGYATLKTANGIEAIELARAHHPDLILMDIQLPEVSGLEVTKWLKEDEEFAAVARRNAENRGDGGTHCAGNRSYTRFKGKMVLLHTHLFFVMLLLHTHDIYFRDAGGR